MSQFNSKHGVAIDDVKLPSIHDPTMPSQLFERFEERLHDDRLKAETRTLVVSLQEEEMQINKNPHQPKQLDITVDSDLTIQTRKHCMSSMSSGIEELQKRYNEMTHLCLLEQMRQSSRAPFADLIQGTFRIFLDELLSEEKMSIDQEIDGFTHFALLGSNCLNYEFQLSGAALNLAASPTTHSEGPVDSACKSRALDEALSRGRLQSSKPPFEGHQGRRPQGKRQGTISNS